MLANRAHAADCAVNDGPAFLPGPCDCGLDFCEDPLKLFRPLAVLGARGGRWSVRHRNVEAFIEAEERPAGNGRVITLTIHLEDAHGWPVFGASADGVDFDNSAAVVISECEAKATL